MQDCIPLAFSILRNMYQNSYAYIKLSGHLSRKISINKGTEQGHPFSPDLFKLFLNDLSPLVNFSNCPKLSNLLVSHLLRADDLILLSLDKATAQKQLDALQGWRNELKPGGTLLDFSLQSSLCGASRHLARASRRRKILKILHISGRSEAICQRV